MRPGIRVKIRMCAVWKRHWGSVVGHVVHVNSWGFVRVKWDALLDVPPTLWDPAFLMEVK